MKILRALCEELDVAEKEKIKCTHTCFHFAAQKQTLCNYICIKNVQNLILKPKIIYNNILIYTVLLKVYTCTLACLWGS